MSVRTTSIYFLGKTVRAGKTVDFNLVKSDLSATYFAATKRLVWVDLGYLGIKDWLPTQLMLMPYKKPRTSKANPTPTLPSSQKVYNKFVGSNRVRVEHAIAGLKRYAILVNRFRNKKLELADEMIALAAGLWNFKVLKRLN